APPPPPNGARMRRMAGRGHHSEGTNPPAARARWLAEPGFLISPSAFEVSPSSWRRAANRTAANSALTQTGPVHDVGDRAGSPPAVPAGRLRAIPTAQRSRVT